MVFSSPLFICLFLPAALLFHLILPPKVRNLWLLLVSILFYAWGEPKYIIILLATTVFDYCSGLLLGCAGAQGKKTLSKAILAVTVAANIGCLCFFKYTDLVVSSLNGLFSAGLPVLEIALPIGISFYTFQTLSYVIDVYRGRVSVQKNFCDFFMFVTLFPQLIAGPIVRYSDIESEISERHVTASDFADGVCRFCIGLGKKALLANSMAEIVKSAAEGEMTVVLAWCSALAFMFEIYFDFSGYSDMAIGIGQMLGFRFPENFRYPYEADSITDFWRRWHITLSSWFREYLYIPLGGNRRGRPRQILNLFIVWSLTGLWHGGAWNFLFWGLYFFVILMLEKLFLLRVLEKLPSVLRHLYALVLIFFGWVLFAGDETGKLVSSLRAMFGIGVSFTSERSIFILTGAAALFIICAAASTHYPARLMNKLTGKIQSADVRFLIKGIICLLALTLSVAFLIGDSYNPFLYFRF